MMQEVPSADVVVRNPTHYAVALKYDRKTAYRAPVVVAKGTDALALRIVAVAEEHNVYITENRPLARGLYEAVDIGQEIPESFTLRWQRCWRWYMRNNIRRCHRENDRQTAELFAAVSRSKFRLCGCEPQAIPPLRL